MVNERGLWDNNRFRFANPKRKQRFGIWPVA